VVLVVKTKVWVSIGRDAGRRAISKNVGLAERCKTAQQVATVRVLSSQDHYATAQYSFRCGATHDAWACRVSRWTDARVIKKDNGRRSGGQARCVTGLRVWGGLLMAGASKSDCWCLCCSYGAREQVWEFSNGEAVVQVPIRGSFRSNNVEVLRAVALDRRTIQP